MDKVASPMMCPSFRGSIVVHFPAIIITIAFHAAITDDSAVTATTDDSAVTDSSGMAMVLNPLILTIATFTGIFLL